MPKVTGNLLLANLQVPPTRAQPTMDQVAARAVPYCLDEPFRPTVTILTTLLLVYNSSELFKIRFQNKIYIFSNEEIFEKCRPRHK